jgi:hypothetical protein
MMGAMSPAFERPPISKLPPELFIEICRHYINTPETDYSFVDLMQANIPDGTNTDSHCVMTRSSLDHTMRHDRLQAFREIAAVCKAWAEQARVAFWETFHFAASDDLAALAEAVALPTSRPGCIQSVLGCTYGSTADIPTAVTSNAKSSRQVRDLHNFLPFLMARLPKALHEFVLRPGRSALGQGLYLAMEPNVFQPDDWRFDCHRVDIMMAFVSVAVSEGPVSQFPPAGER